MGGSRQEGSRQEGEAVFIQIVKIARWDHLEDDAGSAML